MSDTVGVALTHHHTAVCVSDWAVSAAFYEQLGFRVENDWYWPDGVRHHKSLLRFRDREDCWLELFEFPEGRGRLTDRYTRSAGCVYHFALETFFPDDVDRLYQYALDLGGRPGEAPETAVLAGAGNADWAMRRASVLGPDGERIAFLCPIAGQAPVGCTVGEELDGVKGFHHNALRVADLDRSVGFYQSLGFETAGRYWERGTNLALMRLPNGNGLLLRGDGREGLPTDVERMQAAGSMFQYCFWVNGPEEIDRAYDFCVAHGARERIRPFWHEAYGLSHWVDKPAFVYGPDDEILEFLYIDYQNN